MIPGGANLAMGNVFGRLEFGLVAGTSIMLSRLEIPGLIMGFLGSTVRTPSTLNV